MAFSLIWLPDVLKSAGLKVALVPGWEDRGAADSHGNRNMGTVLGVICHHTGVKDKSKNMPTLHALINGRKAEKNLKAIPGPLAQLGLGRDGTFFVVAAGRSNHAGTGIWLGLTNGNANFIGIEAENTGGHDDFPWPDAQLEAYQRGVAAILKHAGRTVDFCVGHREWAPSRKDDPTFDMVSFRTAVAGFMGDDPGRRATLIPRTDPTGRPTIRRSLLNDEALVKLLQTKLGLEADGKFGAKTEAAMRVFQRQRGLVPDGIVGPKTWVMLDTVT